MSTPLEFHGNDKTMNLDSVLLNAIRNSDYFKALSPIRSFTAVIDEIYNNVVYLAPYCPNSKVPSAAYCILFKFFLMKLTSQQMLTLLEHGDSPYIRSIGLMYLRYCHTPSQIWEWYEAYFDDQELVNIHPRLPDMTMSKFMIHLLTESKIEESLLPRLPFADKKHIDSKIEQFNKKKGKGSSNERYNKNDRYKDDSQDKDRYRDDRNRDDGNKDDRYHQNSKRERYYEKSDKSTDDRYYNSDKYYNDDRKYVKVENKYDDRHKDNDNRYHSRDHRDRYNNNNNSYSNSRKRSRSRSNERDDYNNNKDNNEKDKIRESETLKKLRTYYGATSDEYKDSNNNNEI